MRSITPLRYDYWYSDANYDSRSDDLDVQVQADLNELTHKWCPRRALRSLIRAHARMLWFCAPVYPQSERMLCGSFQRHLR